MTNKLIISITFLDDLYHGQGNYEPEFPPSPHRLFQAIVAANGHEIAALEPVLRFFQLLGPPDIFAPETQDANAYTNYVPNNDADVGKKYARQDRLAGKKIRPMRMTNGRSVYYVWEIKPEDTEKAGRLTEIVRRISALGWGIDLVAADCKVATELCFDAKKFCHWKPTARQTSSVKLRVPVDGTLKDLIRVYQSSQEAIRVEKKGRSAEKIYTPPMKPTSFQMQSYECTELPERPCAFFELRNPGDDTRLCYFDQRNLLYVSAMLRHAVLEKAKATSFFELHHIDIEKYIAGHASETETTEGIERFSYMPVPTINFRRTDDGFIRRVIVAEPFFGNESTRGLFASWVQKNLAGEKLCEKGGPCKALLMPVSYRDAIFRMYTDKSKTFATVTPLILPGCDDFKYAKTEKLVLKSFVQAGFDVSQIENLEIQKAPYFPGAFHPRDYRRPEYLKHKSMIHVAFELKQEIHGPVALGPGRHLGFGLFAKKGKT